MASLMPELPPFPPALEFRTIRQPSGLLSIRSRMLSPPRRDRDPAWLPRIDVPFRDIPIHLCTASRQMRKSRPTDVAPHHPRAWPEMTMWITFRR